MDQLLPLVALAGTPNCGKTSLFNAITGSSQRVANFPGITVEKKQGSVIFGGKNLCHVLDLPGSYSLDFITQDERVTADILLGRSRDLAAPDAVIVVVDSTNLERSLYLALELIQLGYPLVLALNLFDVAKKRGLEIDLEALSKELGVPVVSTVAVDRSSTSELLEKLQEILQKNGSKNGSDPCQIHPGLLQKIKQESFVKESFQNISAVLKKTVIKPIKPDTWTLRLDPWVLHPFWGILLLVFTLLVMFQAVFSWAVPMMDGVNYGVGLVSAWVSEQVSPGGLQSFLVDGVIAGVGNVLIFLPQIALLFTFILFLEDLGYLGRAAYLMDAFMRRLGLPGKAAIPLLSSHACAIPGIMAARTLENERDRVTTMLVAPLTTCSARLPVYALLISAFVPADLGWGPFHLPGLILFFLYALGFVSALIIALVLKKSVLKGSASLLLMELPPYRMPSLRNLLLGVWQRCKIFLRRAGTTILVLSMVLWGLVTYPKAPENFRGNPVEVSYAAQIGKALEPIFAPLGYDWRITTALIPSFGAREIVVASLGTVLAVEAENEDELETHLSKKIQSAFSVATLLSLLIWFVFSPQCVSTFAILRRETNSWKWPLVMGAYTLALAYGAAFLTFQVTSRIFS
jgi:ferrous iron transport protein B